jgi:hypothetical protein
LVETYLKTEWRLIDALVPKVISQLEQEIVNKLSKGGNNGTPYVFRP